MSNTMQLLITIYQQYINDGRKDKLFNKWIKYVGIQYRYQNALVALKKEIENSKNYSVGNITWKGHSPLIIVSKYIVENLILPKYANNRFAAQVDILQELEGAPYYGAIHTAELLSMILKNVDSQCKEHYHLSSGKEFHNINNIISCFGNSLNGDTSILFKKSPEKSFMACGANWKPANINMLGVYQPILLQEFNLQFQKWLENNSNGGDQSTYQGKYFNDFKKQICSTRCFGPNAKMYWMKDGKIIDVNYYKKEDESCTYFDAIC